MTVCDLGIVCSVLVCLVLGDSIWCEGVWGHHTHTVLCVRAMYSTRVWYAMCEDTVWFRNSVCCESVWCVGALCGVRMFGVLCGRMDTH